MIIILLENFIFHIVFDHRKIHDCDFVGLSGVRENNGEIAVEIGYWPVTESHTMYHSWLTRAIQFTQ